MIVTRTPFRITLGGGGTDVPSYADEYGGYLITGAINRYLYVAVNENFNDNLLLRYSRVERVLSSARIQHRLLRAIFDRHGYAPLEVSVMADVPAGTGLGSSGAFTVGVLHALHTLNHTDIPTHALAEEAAQIEIEVLKDPIGRQDQYIAAVGGLTAFSFHPSSQSTNQKVDYRPLTLEREVRQQLEENLLLFYTGRSRSAAEVLANTGSPNLDEVKRLGWRAHTLLSQGQLSSFGHLLSDQWALKLEAAPTTEHRAIGDLIHRGIAAGALGGKLVGAGNGGFLLFYTEDRKRLRKAMNHLSLRELPFAFDYSGSTVIVR